MTDKRQAKERFVKYHANGSIWAKGTMVGGKPDGYFEWFRLNGTRMRSGYFRKGKQVGKWTTFDSKGRIVRVTNMKST